MGVVNPRLVRMYQAVKPGLSIPVILTLESSPTPQLVDELSQVVGAPVRTSEVFNIAYTMANEDVAKRLAQIRGVKEVAPDEPTHAL